MGPEDDAALEALAAEEAAAEEAKRERRARRRRVTWAVVAVVGVLAFAGCALWAVWADGERAQTVTLIGRMDQDVRVEIDGERSVQIQARGGLSLHPSSPGPRRFRFISEDGHTFERVYDVPQNASLGDIRLAIPTEEDRCFAMLDVNAWYGEAVSISELLRLRAEEAERRRTGQPAPSAPLPRPRLIARIRPLDPLPVVGYTRNLYLHPTIGPDTPAVSLVDLSCAELELDDDALIDRALELHAGAVDE